MASRLALPSSVQLPPVRGDHTSAIMSSSDNQLDDAGWEARQDRTGRLYFVDHTRKCTSWEDPRPLPAGWECKTDEKLKRRFFVDHNTKSTTWTDPRPPIQLPIPKPATSPMASEQESASASQGGARASYDGARTHKQDLEWYKDVLQMSLSDKSLTADEDELLSNVRAKLKISTEEHKRILAECGWTPNEFEGMKRDDPWRRECCICIAAPATHIVLDCFHLCLCEPCAKALAVQPAGPGRERLCPKCRSAIRTIHKTY